MNEVTKLLNAYNDSEVKLNIDLDSLLLESSSKSSYN